MRGGARGPTIHLASAGAEDAALADSLARALPRALRGGRGRGRLGVQRSGDPAVADWFLLLASPGSAASDEVGDAIRRRVAARGVDQFQVVVTSGTWVWDQAADRLDAAGSTAAHPALTDAFPREPRHMVHSGGWGLDELAFREQVAEIVAPVHGLTKDELFGEEVRHQQRTRRLTRATAASLALLILVAVGGGLVARSAAAEADRQRTRADAERVAAEQERTRAQVERDNADSRRLAALAAQVSSQDGALARLLAIEAYRIAETEQAAVALRAAALTTDSWDPTQQAPRVRRLIGHEPRPVDAAFAPSGNALATVDGRATLRFWSTADTASPTEVPGINTESLAWSHDGARLGAATGGTLLLFDADGSDRIAVDASGERVGAWGPDGFVLGSSQGGVSLVRDGAVVAERSRDQLQLGDVVIWVGGSTDGSRVVVGSSGGEVLTLDEELAVVDRWQLDVAVDQFGERDSRSLLAWDGGDRVVLPPDNRDIRGPILGPQGPEEQDRALAGVYDRATGRAIEPVRGPESYFPLPATTAGFLPDGGAVAVSLGGLEAPPSLGTTPGVDDLSDVPLPSGADLVRVSPDGRLLLLGGTDTAATLQPLPGEATEPTDQAGGAGPEVDATASVRDACATAGRNLSTAEWEIYLPGRSYRATCDEYTAPYEPEETGSRGRGGAGQQDGQDGQDGQEGRRGSVRRGGSRERHLPGELLPQPGDAHRRQGHRARDRQRPGADRPGASGRGRGRRRRRRAHLPLRHAGLADDHDPGARRVRTGGLPRAGPDLGPAVTPEPERQRRGPPARSRPARAVRASGAASSSGRRARSPARTSAPARPPAPPPGRAGGPT